MSHLQIIDPAHLLVALLVIACTSLMVTLALVQVVLQLLRAAAVQSSRIEGLHAALLVERTSTTPRLINGGRQ